MTASVTHGRALRYAGGSARGLLHHHPGHCPIDITSNSAENWRYLAGVVFGEAELDAAGGEARPIEIFGRWIASRGHGQDVAYRLGARYSDMPRKLTLRVSAKDGDIGIGTSIDVTSRVSVDSEGRALTERWQVMSAATVATAQAYQLDLQSDFPAGRYAFQMADTANDFASATATEIATGGYQTADNGTMADGSDGYLMQ